MSDTRTERRLLRACRRGDEPAARSLHALMFPLLTAHARTILRDGALAEDAAQSALGRIFETATIRIDLVRDPRAWLIGICRREALMLLRTRSRMQRREIRAGKDARVSPSAEAVPLTEQIALLPRQLQEVLVLKHVAGLTFDQMELSVGVSRDTLASRYRRALELLRRSMSGELPEASVVRTTGATKKEPSYAA